MDNPIVLIVIAFVFAVLGLALGLAIGALRSRGKTADQPPPPPSRTTPRDSIEILSIWRSERSGKLRAIMDGSPLSPSRMTETQKSRLTQIFVSIYKLVGEPVPGGKKAGAGPGPASTPQDLSPAPSEPVVDEAAPSEVVPVDETEEQGDSAEPQAAEPLHPPATLFSETLPERMGFRDVLTSNPFRAPSLPERGKASGPQLSIIEQINEILQSKLLDSPLEHKDIRLQEIPGGMAVLIGLDRFDGVDEVPDPEIRALIKEAAREWNEKASRKRNS